jgi:hypothetical protein
VVLVLVSRQGRRFASRCTIRTLQLPSNSLGRLDVPQLTEFTVAQVNGVEACGGKFTSSKYSILLDRMCAVVTRSSLASLSVKGRRQGRSSRRRRSLAVPGPPQALHHRQPLGTSLH